MSGSTTGSQTGNFVLGNLLAHPGQYVDPTQAKKSFMPAPAPGQPADTRQPWEQILLGRPSLPENPGTALGQDAVGVGRKEEKKVIGAATGKGGGSGFMDILLK